MQKSLPHRVEERHALAPIALAHPAALTHNTTRTASALGAGSAAEALASTGAVNASAAAEAAIGAAVPTRGELRGSSSNATAGAARAR